MTSSGTASGLKVTNYKNGYLGREIISDYQITERTPVVGGETRITHTTINSGTVSDVDYRPILRALDPSFPKETTSDTVMGDLSVKGITVTVPKENLTLTMDDLSFKDMGLAAKSGSLLTLLDHLASGQEVDSK
ncbi:hypothetical protein [Breoghania sp.]|uniref:hypothetical protein n=1 Tax=Breoghania sp. TaxID=2065378 RepID=UPI00263188E9|nr:hypothetical protein [Breoghania sp.]MDJ0930814.1 hypothetical protein [Breoghania sp.]